MTAEEIKILISKGEGLQLEFKQAFNAETIEPSKASSAKLNPGCICKYNRWKSISWSFRYGQY
jgi:hypothetical protein